MAAPFIMLVDDEVPFVNAMVKRLRQRNIETIPAFSGEACLEKLKDHPDLDVIVLDVKMPEMDGIETLKRIKVISPSTEVILLTGNATVESGIKGLKLGAFDYLMKPCEMADLLEKVEMAAQKKRMHQ